MSTAMIRTFDDPILSVVCDGLSPEDDLLFVDDMRHVLNEREHGDALAAPQIGVARCAILVWPLRQDQPMVMINPVIVSRGAESNTDVERCLSYPDSTAPIDRNTSITCRYFDQDWNLREKRFVALPARLIQHAVGHLQGKCPVGAAWRRARGGI